MNKHDSEHISGVLSANGFIQAEELKDAEIVILNTCSVRKSAEDKIWGKVEHVRTNCEKVKVIAVCGCMAERLGESIQHKSPSIGLVFGLDTLNTLPDLIEKSLTEKVCDTGSINESNIENQPRILESSLHAWVPISYGCDNFCSYCIVPFVRGRHRSRPESEIIEEVKELASKGVIEFTLLGQNVNAYGTDLYGRNSFASLLEKVANTGDVKRVRFETSHPLNLDIPTLEVMAGHEQICNHLHLPLQSGSNKILKLMNRGYSHHEYLEKVNTARAIVKDLALSTDLIVGYPGESEYDFLKTFEMVRKIEFDNSFIFKFSPREGTESFIKEDDVPDDTKVKRLELINELQSEITKRSYEKMVGKTFEILIEGKAKRGDFNKGRTKTNHVVLLPSETTGPDSLVYAVIENAGKHTARGKLKEVILKQEKPAL